MNRLLTPATERALQEAILWSDSQDSRDVPLAAILLGLLAEPECRAAAMLLTRGIEAHTILTRWPTLERSTLESDPAVNHRHRALPVELDVALAEVEARLCDHPQPLIIATEHLLLGVATSQTAVGKWLTEIGLGPEALESAIQQVYGIVPGPLEVDHLAAGPLMGGPLELPDSERTEDELPESDPLEFDEPLGAPIDVPSAISGGPPPQASDASRSHSARGLLPPSASDVDSSNPAAPAGQTIATSKQTVDSVGHTAATPQKPAASTEQIIASPGQSAATDEVPASSTEDAHVAHPLGGGAPGRSATVPQRQKEESPSYEKSRPGSTGLSGEITIYRILDAATNRSREALRVVEDYLRFALDDRHLCEICKQMRHDFSGAVEQFAGEDYLSSRDTLADVGTTIETESEYQRPDALSVLQANFLRLQEALRSLEEYSKIAAPEAARQFEALRYRAYTLQRATIITEKSLARLASARLYVLVDGGSSLSDFESFCGRLIEAGVHVLQLRDKSLDDRRLLERACALRRLTQRVPTLMVMNDRPDLAVLSRADGVHVGQEELSVKEVRGIVGPRMLVGVSTHSLQQARDAVLAGANYIGVGPTFPSVTKSFEKFTGAALLEVVAREVRLPAFAIGGINAQNLSEVLASGFRRVAVSGAITHAADPSRAAREMLRALG
jgi:thiamine-phosphate pyrophosphorylase